MDERAWTISFGCDTSRVPDNVLNAVREHLEDMGRALMLIESASPFWSSLRESGMRFDVGGWRFTFRVTADSLVLEEVEPAML